MMNLKNQSLIIAIGAILFLSACGDKTKTTPTLQETKVEAVKVVAPVYNTKDPKSMIVAVEFAQGSWNNLWEKKDVQYNYDYRYPDGKADVSTERYVFSNEASFGNYTQHDINAMPGAKGNVTQYFDGKTTIAMLRDKKVDDAAAVGTSEFLRRANYFWFVMPYKLNDKGTILKSIGQEVYNGTTYDKVEVTYDAAITGKEQNDIYILYINPTTKMIDRFFFSLPAMGVNVPAIIANYTYEDIDGQKVATKRTYFMPNEKGAYGDTPSIKQTLTNVTFNNGFTSENIMKVN